MTIEEIKPYIEQISEKLGQGAQFTWDVILKQQYIEGILFAIASIICLSLFILMILKWKQWALFLQENDYVLILGFLFLLAMTFVFSVLAVFHIYNPEYQAIIDIITPITSN